MVSFAGLEFIFRFLPIFFILYYIVPKKHRDTVLLIGSLFFYAVGEPLFLLLFLLLIEANYLLGRKVAALSEFSELPERQQKKRKCYMLQAVLLDIFVLVLFKGLSLWTDNKIWPLGLSFYLFKMISYQIDIYRGVISDRPGLKTTALYFMLFPQVTSGPIMRYEEGKFLRERSYCLERFEEGLVYFVTGLGMKVLLADRLAILWKDLHMIGFQSISTPLAWFGMAGYSLQIYFDFWGYSLMASGLLMMLGFDWIENFRHPYASKSISEFYRRWHMTLGSFFRDYVYFPMGGSRCSKGKTVRNLAIVWLLTGIWHGNGFNFVIWGLVLGLFIILEKTLYGKKLVSLPVLGHIYVLFLIPLTWVIFAITDLNQLLIYFERLFPVGGGRGMAVNPRDIVNYAGDYGIFFVIGIILCIPAVFDTLIKHRKNVFVILMLMLVFWASVYYMASSAGNPFLYLNF